MGMDETAELTLSEKSLKTRVRKRQIVHGVGVKNVRDIIGKIEPGLEIYTITTGSFHFINVIEELINQITKPVHLDVSSWTITNFEIGRIDSYMKSGSVEACRFLTDRSFPQRHGEVFEKLKGVIGEDNVRVARWHCKYCLIYNDDWSFCVRTSANLNQNRRGENYEISDDAALLGYMVGLTDEIFQMSDGLKHLGRREINRLKGPELPKVETKVDGLDWILRG